MLVVNQVESYLFISNMYHFSRKEKCFDETNHYFLLAANSLYLKKFVSTHQQQFVSNYVNDIKEDYINFLNVNLETEQEARKQLDTLAVGSKSVLDIDDVRLKGLHEHLIIREFEYFEMILELELFFFKNRFHHCDLASDNLENLLSIQKKQSIALEGGFMCKRLPSLAKF